MNKNIEVICECLWAVDMDYVRSGFIQELHYYPQFTASNEPINLGSQGMIILNKKSLFYPVLKQAFIVMMKKSDNELQKIIDSCTVSCSLNEIEDFYVNVAGWEIKRRSVRTEYLSHIPKPTLKNKIIKYLRKVGIK